MILAVLVGLISSTATIYPLIFSVIWGIIAEAIAAAGKHASTKMYLFSYCVFNLTSVGPFFAIILAKDAFLAMCATYYGQDYADTLDWFTPDWIIVVFVALAILGAVLGGSLGLRLLKKHFAKAGVS